MQLVIRYNGFSGYNLFSFERHFDQKHVNLINLVTISTEKIHIEENLNTCKTNQNIIELSYF